MILIRSPCRPREHEHMAGEGILLHRLLGLRRQRGKARGMSITPAARQTLVFVGRRTDAYTNPRRGRLTRGIPKVVKV